MLLCVFATSYYVVAVNQADSFTQPMNKVGATYFTVAVFSTVGFGDITAKTDLARSRTGADPAHHRPGAALRRLRDRVKATGTQQSNQHARP